MNSGSTTPKWGGGSPATPSAIGLSVPLTPQPSTTKVSLYFNQNLLLASLISMLP
jgi:hypothetical protein